MIKLKKINIFFLLFFTIYKPSIINAANLENGKIIFQKNCLVCHEKGNNFILPEKNLKKENLEINGMNSINAISYQIRNGKNGMPAFGGRLNEKEIEEVANYIIEQSSMDFKNFE